MARGGKRGHKGGRKQYTNPQELEAARQKEDRERAWRRQQGLDSESEEEGEREKGSDESDDGVAFTGDGATGGRSSSESSSGDEDDQPKRKGVEGLIEVQNPNLQVNKQKKVTALDDASGSSSKPQLSRREREELEKQRAKAHYQKLHAQGKTEEARADLARLAIIRKQREEAAKKREEEKQRKEAEVTAKKEATNKALGKKK